MLEFFHGLTNSPYQGILGQYFDHTGRIGSEVEVSEYVDTSVAAPTEVEGAKVEEEAVGTVKKLQWPIEISDQYIVLPAPGTTYTVSTAPFCAYHAWPEGGAKYTYAFVPYMGDKPFNACLSADPKGNPAHVTSAAAAHEYAESTTNPHIGPGRSAWTTTDAPHYEIADICQFEDVQLSNGTWASALWDNSQNECSQADSAKPELYAQTQKATDVGPHGADLHANIYGEGLETEYHFEYGLTTSYGSSGPSATLKAGGAIDAVKEIDLLASGLELEKTYHFRLVATNSSGTFHGQDHVFNTSKWSIQQAATLPTGASGLSAMRSVSCSSATFCAAVGTYFNAEKHFVTDAETWDGSQWTLQPTPNPAGATGSELLKVSCKSESLCMAVGNYTIFPGKPKTLTERWNGSEWSIVTSPNPSEAVGAVKLVGVSCASVTSCTAVGRYVTQLSGGAPTEEKTLAETWSGGSEWSIVASPNPSGQALSSLSSVSCGTTGSCVATGSSQETVGKASVPLVERYDGKAWSTISTPSPAGATTTSLGEVSCRSAAFCMTVGNSSMGGFSAIWNGSEWSPLPGVVESAGGSLSCASETTCSVIGAQSGQLWNGSEWLVAKPQNPPDASQLQMSSISCTAASACTAVGSYYENGYKPLAERLPANWSITSTPNPPGPTESSLGEVSCRSAAFCMAVGNANLGGGSGMHGFAEKWNLTEWVVQAGYISQGSLSGVSCASSSWCTAVGQSSAGLIAEHWNGSTWSVQSVPKPSGASQEQMSSISCTSESACTAVGSYYENGYKALAERWNGSAWSIQQTATLPTGASGLSAMRSVSCASATFCTAVGGYYNAENQYVTDAETWNGSQWTLRSTPNPSGAVSSELLKVSCKSESLCMAVGNYRLSSGTSKTLTERWNGSEWSIVTSPNPSEAVGAVKLSGVSCPSATSCTAVGRYVTQLSGGVPTEEKTLVETWSGGSEWSIVASPNPGGQALSSLASVSCTTIFCTATGSSQETAGKPSVSLAEYFYSGQSWSTISTPNPPGPTEPSLGDVACRSAASCMVVGNANPGGGSGMHGFTEKWNLPGLTVQAGNISQGSLNGVSCSSESACTAVGQSAAGLLAERWNGSTWSAQSVPRPSGASQEQMSSVSCASESACTAVGSYYESGFKPLAERWNGSAWSIQQIAPLPEGAISQEGAMRNVSCASATFCAAVGTYYNSAEKHFVTDAETWDGSQWTLRSTPNPVGATGSELLKVSCKAESFCMAVGNYNLSLGKPKTLTERWNGSEWSIVTSPNPSEAVGAVKLVGVSCASVTSCTAVGRYVTQLSGGAPTEEKTLAETWSGGSEWSIVASPNPSGQALSSLSSVSCSTTVTCVATGSSQETAGKASVPLVETYE